MPRPSSRALTPRRFSATRATPLTWAAGAPSDCTPLTRSGRRAGVSTSSSPVRTVPACRVPVTTVPLPLMANTRSSQSRTPPPGSGSGSRAASRPSAATSSGRPWPVSALTATASTSPRLVSAILSFGLLQRGRRVGQVGPGDHQQPVADAEGVDRREMFGRLGHPALVGGHHEQHPRCRARAGEHVRYESFVPGHVDERDLLARTAASSRRSRGRWSCPGAAPPPTDPAPSR